MKHANPRTLIRGRSSIWQNAVLGHARLWKIGYLPTGYEPKDFSAGLSCIKSLAGSCCVSDIFILKASIGDLLRHLLEIL